MLLIDGRRPPAPVTPKAPPAPAPHDTPSHAVVRSAIGDSLQTVGKRYGVSADRMARANPGAGANEPLRVGTPVTLPVGNAAGEARVHVPQPGESAADVARRHGVSEAALRSANGLSPSMPLTPGQAVLVPAQDDGVDTEALKKSLTEAGIDLAKMKPEDAKKVVDAARQLRDGDTAEKLDALATLAETLPADKIPDIAESLGVTDSAALKLATDKSALRAAATLADPKASAADKVAAALTLGSAIGQAQPDAVKEVLERRLAALPAGAALAKAIGTWSDPNASGLDKARAALDVATAAKEATGNAFPQLAQKLRGGDSLARSAAAGLMLLDPNASLQDKAKAAAELAANIPSLKGDVKQLAGIFRQKGVADADTVAGLAANESKLAALPKELREALKPEVAAKLGDADFARLTTLAADKDMAGELARTLGNLEKPESASALIRSLADGPGDKAAKLATLKTLGGMGEGEADRLLASTVNGKPAAEVLAKFTAGLGEDELKNLPTLLKEFSGDQANMLLRIADKDTSGSVGKLLKYADKIDSKLAGEVIGGFGKLLSKAGIELTGEVATKLAKGLGKVIPIAGAVPAAKSAWELGRMAADTSLPPALRFLALEGSKLNAIDAGLSVAEPFIAEFFGIPVAADVAIGAAELAIDLVLTDQKAKFEADPAGYQAPAWLDAANVGIAAAQGPQGLLDLATMYGANGTVDLLGRVARGGGTAAIRAAELAVDLPSDMLRANAHATAEGLHLLADVIRNPGKYGDAAERLGRDAVDRLSSLAQQGGQLAKAAAGELKDLVGDLKDLGVQGAKALGWIASHPGEAARAAAQALGDLAQKGIELGGAAGRALAQAAMEGLGAARKALGAAGQAVDAAVDRVVDAATAAGKAGIETLGWIASHPGEAATIAGRALVSIAGRAGELAHEAVDAIAGLGQKGVALGREVVGQLKSLGERGIDTLEYVASHPGEAARELRQEAGEALGALARGAGQVADKATDALLRLVDNGIAEVKDTVTTLLAEGGAALERAAKHWAKNLSEGGREIIGGLKDLGDAGIDALEGLARGGVRAAGSALESIGRGIASAGGWVIDKIF